MPNVVGLATANAVAQVSAAGFVVDLVEEIAPLKPIGKVFWQNPAAGSSRPTGSLVVLKIPKIGIAPLVQVPNLIGLTPNQAKNALLAKGLVSDGKLVIAFGKPHGRVYSQNRAPGTWVAPDTQVSWRWNP